MLLGEDFRELLTALYDGGVEFLRPNQIDVLTRISGVSFDEACAGAGTLDVDGRPIPVIGLDALLRNKRASGRPKDLVDVEALTGDE